MKKPFFYAAAIAALLTLPSALFAATDCDSQAKPAFDCPTGYSMMCIPTGGDHWGCGKEGAGGGIEETNPVNPAPSDPAVLEPAAQPAPAQAPAPTTTQTTAVTAPSAPPSGPAPTTTVAPVAPAANPVEPAAAEQAVPGPQPLDSEVLEEAQGFLEDFGEEAPSALQPVIEAVAATLGVIVAFLGIWEWLKRMKEKKTGKCDRCGGDKDETKEEKKCARCGGKGKIEEEYEVTVKCSHCKGSGVDPCHYCGGTGKMSLPNPPQSQEELEGWPPCDFCGGSGVKKIGAGRDWGEANDAVKNGQFACCFCHGKKSETAKLKREVTCPDCKGSGKG